MARKIILISQFSCYVDGIDNLYKKITIYKHTNMPMDIKKAIQYACTDYIGTEEGHLLYEKQNHEFDYTAFVLSVPNTINQKYGFQVARFSLEHIKEPSDFIQVPWDENLVRNTQILDYETWKQIKECILDVTNLHRKEYLTQLCHESELPLPKHFCDTSECECLLDTIRERLHPSRFVTLYEELKERNET